MNKKALITISFLFLTLFIGKALACVPNIADEHYVNHEVGLCTTLTYEDREKGFSLIGNWENVGDSGVHFEFEETYDSIYDPTLCGFTEEDVQPKTFDQCCDNLGYTYTEFKSLDDEFINRLNIIGRVIGGSYDFFFEKEIIYLSKTEYSSSYMTLAHIINNLFYLTIIPVLIVLVLIKFKKINNPKLKKFIKYYFLIFIPLMTLILLHNMLTPRLLGC